MTINPSGQYGSSQLRKYLGDNPAEVIRSAASLSQFPSSVNESFELLGEVFKEACDGLREEVIEALREKLLPWLDKNPTTLADLPFLNEITPLPPETIEEHEIEWLRLEDRCFDGSFPQSVRAATLKILDLCDGGNRIESEQLRLEEEQKRIENAKRQAEEEWRKAVELDRQRNPLNTPLRKIHFSGISVRQDLLFFDSFRIEISGNKVKLFVPAGKSEAVIGVFKSSEELNEWMDLFKLFKSWAGDRFRKSENTQLQSNIDSFEAMLKQQNSRDSEISSESAGFLEEPSSPAPEKFIDPLMPSSDKYDMPEYDHQ